MKFFLFVIAIVSIAFADVGKVTVVKGDALVQRDVKVFKVYDDMGLFKQDIVETDNGRLQMLFNDSTVISLGRYSRFAIKEYLYAPNSNQVGLDFKLEKGFVKTITGLIGKMEPDAFVLETLFTKVTPHGTIWTSDINEKREIYTVIDGRITLSFNDGKARKIDVVAGETMVLEIGTNGTNKMIIRFHKSFQKQDHDTYIERLDRNDAFVKEDQAINGGTVVTSDKRIVQTIDNGTVHDSHNSGGGNVN